MCYFGRKILYHPELRFNGFSRPGKIVNRLAFNHFVRTAFTIRVCYVYQNSFFLGWFVKASDLWIPSSSRKRKIAIYKRRLVMRRCHKRDISVHFFLRIICQISNLQMLSLICRILPEMIAHLNDIEKRHAARFRKIVFSRRISVDSFKEFRPVLSEDLAEYT